MPEEKFENMGGEVNMWTKFEPKAIGEIRHGADIFLLNSCANLKKPSKSK